MRMVQEAGLTESISIDSAGTYDDHIGHAPDPRSIAAAAARGYDPAPLQARQLQRSDFERFDLILSMDEGHRAHLTRLCPPAHAGGLRQMMDYASQLTGENVPDPYYGGVQGFQQVLDMIEDASRGLLAVLRDPGKG